MRHVRGVGIFVVALGVAGCGGGDATEMDGAAPAQGDGPVATADMAVPRDLRASGDGTERDDLASPGDLREAPDLIADYPTWSAKSPAICGQKAYTWQPAANVGQQLEGQKKNLVLTAELGPLLGALFIDRKLAVQRLPRNEVQIDVFRYQTQDRGKLVDATAMVAFPWQLSIKTFPMLLLLHPTISYTDACAPSQHASDLTAPMSMLAMLAASYGYVVVAPDYLNEKSLGSPSSDMNPYLLMEPTAIAALDALRGAKSHLKAINQTTSASDEVYIWGHSQGAQAGEFTIALQPDYAPEFKIVAAALAAPPSDLVAVAEANFKGATPKYSLGEAIAYMWWQYYGGTKITTALMNPWDTSAPVDLPKICQNNYMFVEPADSADPSKIFTTGFRDVMTRTGVVNEPWSCWMHYNNPATMDPPLNKNVPVLYITGDKDTFVYPSAIEPMFKKWCGGGIQMEYLQCSGADHLGALADSIDNVFNWFDDRAAGKALPADLCKLTAATKCLSTP